jgi:hypothetical protein
LLHSTEGSKNPSRNCFHTIGSLTMLESEDPKRVCLC